MFGAWINWPNGKPIDNDTNGKIVSADSPPIEYPLINTSVCTDCNGTKKYIGLTKIEDCRKCNGTGRI